MLKANINRVLAALLAATCGLLLQAPPIDYEVDLFGSHALGSLAHLHVGLLLALALLFADRIYLRTTFAGLLLGWIVRAWGQHYDPAVMIVSVPLYALMYAWTVECARYMGRPRAAAERRIERDDIARFALIGLLLYPLGWALPDYFLNLLLHAGNPADALNDAVQTFFAKHFGVSIMTLPLLLLLGEPPRRRARFGAGDLAVWLMLVIGLGVNLLVAAALHPAGAGAFDWIAAVLDYRFALVAILTWCALRLSPRAVAPILISVQLLLVLALARATPRVEDASGILGVLKVAFELAVLQLLVVLLLIINRDREDLLAHLREESRLEPITGLRNLNGLRVDLARLTPAPQEIGYLTLANLDRLVGGFGLRAQEALMHGVAEYLSELVDSYHMGTGQFALLPTAASIDWEALLRRLEQYDFRYAGESLRLTAYLGVAALQGSTHERIDAALDIASTAAQDAALHGETQPVRAHAALLRNTTASRDALALGSLALARVRARELELFFQPIKRLDAPLDQPLQCGEVLCRLRGADGALLLPHVFLREIEARGRSIELDLAVIDCLFRWVRQHSRHAALPRLGINLTGRSVTSDSFRSTLLNLLDTAPLPPGSLCFEITETEAIARFDAARRLLEDLRVRGCSIALDDFGVGMQSLERLRELQFDIVKIDGSFVRGIAARGRDYELVHAAASLARACGAEIVAEYVENAAIADCLRELGVRWGQGDYFGRAAPIELILQRA